MKIVSINNFKAFLTELKTEAEAQGWTTLRDTTTSGIRELILSSTNGAICGFKEYSNGTSYYNILLNYATSYDSTKTFYNQPGSVFNYPDNTSNSIFLAPVLQLHNNTMNVFIFVNVNRIVAVVNGLSKYVSCYVGRYLRNGTMGQIPNNLFCGGSLDRSNQEEPLSGDTSAFYLDRSTSSCPSVFKDELNENIQIANGSSGGGLIHPFSSNYNRNITDISGNVVMFPSLITTTGKNLGELDGIFFLSSIAGVAPENELTIEEDSVTHTYKVFINGNLTSPNRNFFAVEI